MTTKLKAMPLGLKLLLPGLVALAVFVACITAFWQARLSNSLLNARSSLIESAEAFLASPVSDAVWNFDNDLALTALQPIATLEGAVFARVLTNGRLFEEMVVQDYRADEWDGAVDALLSDPALDHIELNGVNYDIVALENDGEQIGQLILAFERRHIDAILADGQKLAALIGAAAFVAFGVVLFLNTLQVTRPHKRLLGNLDDLGHGKFDLEITDARRGDEIGALARALESLRHSEIAKLQKAEEDRLANEEQQKVVQVLSTSMSDLAKGNLSVQIQQEFPPAYEELRSNFNASTGALRAAMLEIIASGDDISSGAREVFAASDTLARQAEAQAGNAAEASMTLSNVSEAMSDILGICREASTEASASQSDVAANSQVVENAVRAMGDIEAATSKIVEIVAEIDQIAFQTNLLALNAGVEAARAGEAGRGFAIVAQEVRNLSGRTSDMASEISQLIQTSADTVGQGVELVRHAGQSMTGVGERVTAMTGYIGNIATSVEEQTGAISELNAAIADVDAMTQNNAALAEETLAASQTMDGVGQQLVECISAFHTGDPSAFTPANSDKAA